MMKAYVEVRADCETMIRQSGLNATLLRLWYVLGPGHRWPYALLPMYWLLEQLPCTGDGARRVGPGYARTNEARAGRGRGESEPGNTAA